ncbi:MAG: hypothetical protein V4787_26010 [Pseudomonadota bacterium]
MLRRHWMRIVWPAFLAACMLELLVFALVDPGELRWMEQGALPSRQGLYTLAFFVFWAIAMVACALTVLLGMPAPETSDELHG